MSASGDRRRRTEPGPANVAADFDRIAGLPADVWNHNAHYHGFLLRQIPGRGRAALHIGCGRGSFARLLASRFERVDAIDISARMVSVARSSSQALPNIRFHVADARTWELPAAGYDCVASLATLHHLDLEAILERILPAIRPGGVLAVLDLYKARSALDWIVGVAAVPVSFVLRLVRTRRTRPPSYVCQAWADHGVNDCYLALAEIRRICVKAIPGARVRRHLLWRYSIIWVKPDEP